MQKNLNLVFLNPGFCIQICQDSFVVEQIFINQDQANIVASLIEIQSGCQVNEDATLVPPISDTPLSQSDINKIKNAANGKGITVDASLSLNTTKQAQKLLRLLGQL